MRTQRTSHTESSDASHEVREPKGFQEGVDWLELNVDHFKGETANEIQAFRKFYAPVLTLLGHSNQTFPTGFYQRPSLHFHIISQKTPTPRI